jgi:hypothetical protein
MPVIPFTDLSLSKLAAEKQTRYLCAGLPGFGILVGRRKKTFFVMHGKERRIETLGKYPAITLRAARLKAVTIIDGTAGIVAAQDPEERIAEYVKGLMGTLLRYPYEVRDEKEYFDEIQDVKVTKDMLDLARHIVTQKTAEFEPDKFEDHYEEALAELINAKRNGKTGGAKPRPRGESVVDLMDALKKSIGSDVAPKGKKPRKAAAGQKEMLLPISGKRSAKDDKKKAEKPTPARARKRA